MKGLNAITAKQELQPTSELTFLKSKLTIPTCEGIHIIKKNDIEYAQSDGNYTLLTMTSGQKILSSKTLKHYAAKLGSPFLRIHSSYLINPSYMIWVSSNKGQVKMSNGDCLQVARSKKQSIIDFMNAYLD